MVLPRIRNLVAPLCVLLLVSSWLVNDVDCAKKAPAPSAPPAAPEATIEEVSAKQLERLLEDKDYVAVYWYARSCTTCDTVLAELEHIDDDTDSFGVDFVKINDKRLAKQYGITKFPALTYFREKEPIIYEGDLMDEAGVLDFLTSLEAMDLPDRIEEVNAKILAKIIEDSDYVAVLFCTDHENCPPGNNNKPECKKCIKALQELENIDDEADQLDIGFVKIHDEDLAEEYNLGPLPKLVYYRHQTPIVYEHELQREEDVLEWLVENKATGDEDDIIEEVNAKTLKTLIQNIDNLVVLFYDEGDDESESVLQELENIDDDCAKHGIQFVRIDDPKVSKEYGIDEVPAIVYFEKQIPNVYDDDLSDEEEILEWLLSQLEKDEIEDVTDEMLDKLIKEGKSIAVLFYDNNDKKSEKVLNELENIDDECDQLGINFVKMDDLEEAKDYGVTKFPKLVYFEQGIPTVYEGSLEQEEDNDIAFVKIDDDNEAKEWGIEELPTMILFERGIPHIYEGDLLKEEELLGWLVHQKRHSEIPEITDEMKDKLMQMYDHVAIIFYDKDDKQDIRVLNELENIDDELEKEEIVIARLDNAEEAREYGLDHLPALVYFENEIPAIYEGDLMNEEEVLEWLKLQKYSATIEEVTDEILQDLIEDHEYVCVYFSGACDEGEKCDKILDDLENIDDELDEAGIIFVTTEDMVTAKKYNIKNLPSLVFFRNKDPLIYSGDLNDEDEVLAWLTDEETLEIPGKIEEVNIKMLEKILYENEHIVVFFYHDDDKKAQKIIAELENIDDECEEKDIDFVKTSDDDIDKEYDLDTLPALVFYRNKFRTIYTGDLMKEEEILEWVLEQYNTKPEIIESVDRKTLQVLVNEVEHLAVLFYDDDCETCPKILEKLETIDDDTDKHHIQFVKANDEKLAHEIGIFSFPALVYYETGVPIMYDGDLLNEYDVLDWMHGQKTDESIQEVERDVLLNFIDTKDFLAVVFYVEEDPDTPKILRHIELIDDEAADYGIVMVKSSDRLMAKKFGFRNPPGVTYFRKGKSINYDGDIDDEEELLDWLTDPHNMEMTDHIEKVNRKMFQKIRQASDYLAVFFYSDDCKQCPRVLAEIEHIDDEADGAGINFVKIDDKQMAKELGVYALPGIVFFKLSSKEPVIYAGDLNDEDEILNWLMTQKNPGGDIIEDLDGTKLLGLIEDSNALAVYFYTDDCEQCTGVLESLENIDDDCDRHGIMFVKTDDLTIAEHYGITDYPVLVYFEDNVPNVFEDKINCNICDQILEGLEVIDDELDVFDKINCNICDQILEGLEVIDDELDVFGIHMVKIQDPQLAKRYSIKTFPALVYFRNGNPLIYEGDLQNEQSVLEWLVDDDNRELADEIEEVNERMLDRLMEQSPLLCVFYYDEDCAECDDILEELELIDGEVDLYGIDFVKVASLDAAHKYGVTTIPSLVYYRKQIPMLYDGDMHDHERVMNWLTSQDVFEIKNEIEEVNRKMLNKLLDENEFLAVYFFEEDHEESEAVLERLELIDSETDNLDITFVKMGDPRYARKWGVTKLPAIVYFRKRFPSIYRGDMYDEQDVLEWLRKNRFRQPELNIFMYALIALGLGFVIYTAFLLQCFKPAPPAPVPHPKQN
ncbi:AGAP006452-PA-like protein [Anopheles sinensis]|uniref:AGAP006452-PA-like protein n=1 Tax=Anopheles sinensis TaxID=74873 RepID=A0A084VAX6_ANOSI|nr:AGAP006452-PA-like protein [Anopheles sinensis]